MFVDAVDGEMVTAPENLPSCIYGLQLNLEPSWEGRQNVC